jgi:hypothetical protein
MSFLALAISQSVHFLPYSNLGGLSFWVRLVEIVVAPPMGVGITLGVLDGYIGATRRCS